MVCLNGLKLQESDAKARKGETKTQMRRKTKRLGGPRKLLNCGCGSDDDGVYCGACKLPNTYLKLDLFSWLADRMDFKI